MSTPHGPVHLLIVEQSTGVSWHAKWRRRMPDGTVRQVKRLVGPAWLRRTDGGGWIKQRGRAPEGYLTEREATLEAHRIREAADAEWAASLQPVVHVPTVDELFRAFIEHRRTVKALRPSTVRDYESVLLGARLEQLRARPIADVTPADIASVLDQVAASGASARTVNKYRAVMAAAWAWGARPTALSLAGPNPAKLTDTRRAAPRPSVDWYSVEEVEALARVLAGTAYRDVERERKRADEGENDPRPLSAAEQEARDHYAGQDPELVRLAAYAGLRLSEIVALRWADIDWPRRAIHVRSTVSAGQLVDAPKSGKHRLVPMSERALRALDTLSRRPHFTGPEDHVAIDPLGQRTTGSALARRYTAARDHAGARPLTFHKLRHTFGSMAAAGGVDLALIQAAMGHAHISTTQIYLHARSSADVADVFTRAQAGEQPADAPVPERQGAP